MNTNNTNNTNVQSLTAAIAALTKVLEEAIDIAKEESTTATTGTTTTTTEVTATTETATTATETTATTEAPIIVIDDDDSVIGVGGSMIEQNPMDLIPAAEAKADDTAAEAEETVPADDEAAEEYLDNITADISALYDIGDYSLSNEGYNISIDNSPYAPKDNKVGSIDNYRIYISKEIIKGTDQVTGEFRMIVSEKNSGVKILDHSLKIINDTIKVFSSENTVRIEKLKESKKLMRFLEIVDEVSSLIMSKYISK